jgi:excinuclease ABC subunit C
MVKQELTDKIKYLPDSPGVYYFLAGKKILYVGKATSLRDRVKSYFSKDLLSARGPLIVKMVEEIEEVKFVQTDSVLEALIYEANEIKKHQPYYNRREKDDRSYNYVILTKEEFPRLLLVRGKNLLTTPIDTVASWGPFPHTGELREALKIIRKIFPYRDEKCKLLGKPCFPAQLGLCPGPCAGWVSRSEYRKTVKHISLFFDGKKPTLMRQLESDMKALAKAEKFEEAERVKRQLFALDHIQDIALMKRDLDSRKDRVGEEMRIEAYDIAHLGGKDVVGVMAVVESGELAKSQYRKFKIKADKNDDVKNMKEVIVRRLGHPEWSLPQLIVVDGGIAQLSAAKQILKERGFYIQVVAVTKDTRHKAKEIIGAKKYIEKYGKEILHANAEAHRFAISYHRLLRRKGFRI